MMKSKTCLSVQSPSAVVMVRPHRFRVNPQTAEDNVFQSFRSDLSTTVLADNAKREVTLAAGELERHGVTVHLFEDQGEWNTPDAVFPNNWFSTHAGGHVAVYPMYAPNRRKERRIDVLDLLKSTYRVQDIIDYSGLEEDQIFLEGTGSMVLDHVDRVAYVAKSDRANPIALERFCTHFNYEPMAFDSADDQGTPIYHTNVLMTIAEKYALIGAKTIVDRVRRQEIMDRLASTGREVIELSLDQVKRFAANALELSTPDGKILAMSTTALGALSKAQKEVIERSASIVALDVPTIELSGGSVRCMLAGIHLRARLNHEFNTSA